MGNPVDGWLRIWFEKGWHKHSGCTNRSWLSPNATGVEHVCSCLIQIKCPQKKLGQMLHCGTYLSFCCWLLPAHSTGTALGKHGVHAFDERSGQKRPCNQLQEKYSSDSSVVGPVSEGSVNTRMHEHLRGRWQQHPARADDLEHFKARSLLCILIWPLWHHLDAADSS